MHLAVVGDHALEAKCRGAFLGDRSADQTSAELCHEIDGLRGDLGGGHEEIALVFPIFVIGDNDHPPLANLFENLRDGIETCGSNFDLPGCLLGW